MFFDTNLVGDRLPRGILCLTYDDGPDQSEEAEADMGPRTAELGAFLHAEGIPATFFAVGKFASGSGDILAGLRSRGHLVANHTYNHPSLPAFVSRGGDVRDQLARTDAAIRDHVVGSVTYLRPPYGDWWLNGQAFSNVAAILNRSDLARGHVGPIGWDIDAGDVGFWRDDLPAEECARAYLATIERIGRGIVLMHDSTADIDEIRPRNRALGLARLLVPELRRRGYRFVRLDEIPQIASAARVSSQWTLATSDGAFVASPRGDHDLIIDHRAQATPDCILGGVSLGEDRWGLRGSNGFFLSPRRNGEIFADSPCLGERESLTVVPMGRERVALRTIDGTYLGTGRDGSARLRAVARTPGDPETFFRYVVHATSPLEEPH